MRFDINDLENSMFDLIDQVRIVFSQEVWDNIFMNCSKNEMFVLMLLYRQADVNMTQIAEYLNAPLNTVTGIVSRMEKKEMVQRIRSQQDKRVVTIILTDFGQKQISDIINMFLKYAQMVIGSLNPNELTMMSNIVGKVIALISSNQVEIAVEEKKLKKITIE